jgi:DNA repair protein RecN (Recombination protein N)
MLQTLRIRNLALLEEVSLDFEAGFTAVTGETGAGKSILLGALSLLAGERAEKSIIRQGAAACEVEAGLYFTEPKKIDALLAEFDLPATDEGLLIIKRSVSRDKAPRISVNGSLATLAALQRLGEHWIDFHGPSEPRRLLKESCQLDLLDLFGRAGAAADAYREKYHAWRELRAEHDRIGRETRLTADQIEFLRNQLARMDALELTDEAIETLERDFARMSRGQELTELSSALASGLTGEDSVQSRLAGLLREARALEGIDAASRPLAERLAAAAVELNDLGAEFSSLSQQLHFEPEQADQLAARMNTWLELKRKHGGDLGAVRAARENLQRQLEIQGDVDGTLARLDKQIAEAEKAAQKLAAVLRAVARKGREGARQDRCEGHRPAGFQEGGLCRAHRAAGCNGPGGRLRL